MHNQLKARLKEKLQSISKEASENNQQSLAGEELSFRQSHQDWNDSVNLGDTQKEANEVKNKHKVSFTKKPAHYSSMGSQNQSKSVTPKTAKSKNPEDIRKDFSSNKYHSSGSSKKLNSGNKSFKAENSETDSIAELSRALFGSSQKRENEPAGPSTHEDIFLESMHKHVYANKLSPKSPSQSQVKFRSASKPSVSAKASKSTDKPGDNRQMFALYKDIEKLNKSSAEGFRRLTTKYEELINDFQPYDFVAEECKDEFNKMTEIQQLASKISEKSDRRRI